MIQIFFCKPKFDEWRKWKVIKRIAEAEPYSNALIGYKTFPRTGEYRVSLYLFFIFLLVKYTGRS